MSWSDGRKKLIKKHEYASNVILRSFDFLLIGVQQWLIQWFVGFSMIVGKNLKIEFGYFDFGSDFAAECWGVDAVAEWVGPDFVLFFLNVLWVVGVVEFVGDVFEVVIFFDVFRFWDVISLKLGVRGHSCHFFGFFFLHFVLQVLS